MTYRTGNHWGVTIVREGTSYAVSDSHAPRPAADDQLVAVVVNGDQALAERICALLNDDGVYWARVEKAQPGLAPGGTLADSCTCTVAGPDPACVVHQGRRARGPKPPPLGPGCICDGSGRTCPRHGAVI